MTSPSNLARLPQEHIKTVQGAILDKFLFHLGKSGNRLYLNHGGKLYAFLEDMEDAIKNGEFNDKI